MLPDILSPLRTLFSGKTSAGARVDRTLPANPPLPYLTYQREGGIPHASNSSEAARVTVYAWGRDDREAHRLAMETREVLLPSGLGTQSFYGRVGDVWFSGVSGLSGPSWIPEPETERSRYLLTFLLHYSRATETV